MVKLVTTLCWLVRRWSSILTAATWSSTTAARMTLCWGQRRVLPVFIRSRIYPPGDISFANWRWLGSFSKPVKMW